MKYRGPDGPEALHREYSARIYRFCYRLCGHAEDAEDLAQDVILLAWRGLDGYAGRAPFGAWLYRIAQHRWRRLNGSGRPCALPLSDELDASPIGDPFQERLARISLDTALNSLPVPHRLAFLLVKAEGFTYREASEILDIPRGTVQYHVHEAMVRLRAILSDEDSEGLSKIKIKCSSAKENNDEM